MCKGSMTIEAVFVVSLLILIILWIIRVSLDLYQQTLEIAALEWVVCQNSADIFRRWTFLSEAVEAIRR